MENRYRRTIYYTPKQYFQCVSVFLLHVKIHINSHTAREMRQAVALPHSVSTRDSSVLPTRAEGRNQLRPSVNSDADAPDGGAKNEAINMDALFRLLNNRNSEIERSVDCILYLQR
jgi:hypothetical protein